MKFSVEKSPGKDGRVPDIASPAYVLAYAEAVVCVRDF